MRYLLDTNIISAISRGRHPHILQRVIDAGSENCLTSVIVAGELRFGCEKVGNAVFSARIERALSYATIQPINDAVTGRYAIARKALERRGKPISQNDLWIAAHALALDLTLVTDNMGEFSRIPGLRVENWLRDDA